MEARRLARERADAERRAREEEEERQVPSPSPPPPRAPSPAAHIFTSLPHRAPSLSLQRELAARALMDAERQLAEAEYRRRVREQEELERTRKAREERDKAEAGRRTRAEREEFVVLLLISSSPLLSPFLAVGVVSQNGGKKRKQSGSGGQTTQPARKKRTKKRVKTRSERCVARSPVVPGSVVCLCFTRWHWLAPTTQPVGWCPCACVVPDLFACLPACLWVVIGALDGRVQIQVGGPEPVRKLPVQTQSHARCGYSPLSRPLSGAPILPTI
jgi:hypothetical protein